MDTVEIPPRFSERNSRFENRPPLTDEEAREKKERYSRRPGMAAMVVESNRLRRTVAIAQVYSLQFLQFGEDDLHQLYGTLSIGVILCADNIFDRQIGNASDHDIDQKGYARLSGPTRPINGQANIVIYARLFKKNETRGLFHPARFDEFVSYDSGRSPCPETLSPVESFGLNGEWLLTERELNDDVLAKQPDLEMPHNKILRHEVDTTVGPIVITYSVFRDGMEAFLRIKLLKCGKELGHTANVYGTVIASSSMFKDPDAKSFVLDLKRDEHTPVRADQFIPLQRPSIVVPHGHDFGLDLCIMHRDLISGKDKVIGKDNRKFTPKCWFEHGKEYISESIDISGDFCLVQVEIFWSPWWAIH